jgi:hypothetical protein
MPDGAITKSRRRGIGIRMKQRTFTWSRVAAAFVLAIGIAVVWGTLVGWISSMLVQLRQPGGQVYETLYVRMDGTPVIVARSTMNYLDTSYRTLDGRPLPDQREQWLTPASIPAPHRESTMWAAPIGWQHRIAGLTSAQRPPVAWYVVRDDQEIGRAYLVGFDEYSKNRVGYIGRGGFRPALPPRNEWFDLGRRRFDWTSSALATTGNVNYGGRANAYVNPAAAEQRLPPSLVYLIDVDRLVEIDLVGRTLRTVYESPGIVSVAIILEPRGATAAEPAGVATNRADATDATANEADDVIASPQLTARVVLRTTDKILILDPPTGAKREYILPEQIRNRNVQQLYAVGNEQLLLYLWDTETRSRPELIWLAMDGSVLRRETLTLSSYGENSELEAAITAALAAPIFVLTILATFLGIPIMLLQSNQVETYQAAIARALEIGWLPLILVPLVCAALTWWTYRLQRKYHRPATGLWCVFVLLLGLPAFLAYWIEHRRPKLESCGECGTIVPRDREACAACNTVFSPPPRLGSEIFA